MTPHVFFSNTMAVELERRLVGENHGTTAKATAIAAGGALVVFVSTFVVPNTWYTLARHLLPLLFVAFSLSAAIAYWNDGFVVSVGAAFLLLAATTNELIGVPPYTTVEYAAAGLRAGLFPGVPTGIAGYVAGRTLPGTKNRSR